MLEAYSPTFLVELEDLVVALRAARGGSRTLIPGLGLALGGGYSDHGSMTLAQLARYAALRGAFLFTALTSVASAQNQTWIRQFGTGDADHALAAASDGSGGVYVSGWTDGSLGGPSAGGIDAWLAHYDGAGNQSWIRQFGTSSYDIATAAAPDGLGGVYVSGVTQGSFGGPHSGYYDSWLAHYDGAGNQTWIRQFGASLDALAFAAASDGSGGVFVSGYAEGSLGGPSAGNWDAWLARYDNAGNQTWIRQFGTTYREISWAVASDGSSGVFVSGSTEGGLGGPHVNDEDAWLAHYDGAGNQTWIRQLGSSGADDARAAAPDGSGGVYVSGGTGGSLGGSGGGFVDAWLARYDGAGNQTWIRQFGLDSIYDGAFATAPDGSGGVFISGVTYGSLGGPHAGHGDPWLAHYGGAGNRTWILQFGTSSGDYALAAAPDGSGGVYVSGCTDGSMAGPSAGGGDAWLAHYDDSLSTVRYCTPAIPNSMGQPGAVTATGSNAVQANNVTLIASSLSLHSFGFFLTSRDQGSVFPVSNSQGRLCLGGFIGRYVGPGQVKSSGSMGTFSLILDLNAMAHPFSSVAAQPGQTWHFQAWHRDANPTLTSNFTDAVSVTFQ